MKHVKLYMIMQKDVANHTACAIGSTVGILLPEEQSSQISF